MRRLCERKMRIGTECDVCRICEWKRDEGQWICVSVGYVKF